MYPEGSGLQSYVETVRRDPLLSRLVVMLLVFALLAPLAWFIGRDGSTVVRSRLPGAAAPAEVVAVAPTAAPTSTTAATSPAPAATVPVTPPPAAPGAQPVPTTAAVAASTAAPATTAKPVPTTVKAAPATAPPAPTTAKPAPTTAPPPPTTAPPAPTAAPTTAPPTTEAPAPPPAPTRTYTREESIAIIREVWPDDLEEKALAIAKRESNFIAEVDNGWCCYGLFQIYFKVNKSFLATQGVTSADQLRDAWVNTRVAFALYQLAGWKPWGG